LFAWQWAAKKGIHLVISAQTLINYAHGRVVVDAVTRTYPKGNCSLTACIALAAMQGICILAVNFEVLVRISITIIVLVIAEFRTWFYCRTNVSLNAKARQNAATASELVRDFAAYLTIEAFI